MSTTTKEHPILFRPELVRKILDGKKTQTRRPVKAAHVDQIETDEDGRFVFMHAPDCPSYCDYACAAAGEIFDKHIGWTPWGSNPKHWGALWVRETWGAGWADGCGGYSALCPSGCDRKKPDKYFYLADGWDESQGRHCWRPSIHMPKEACRLRLEITGVRVERVQSISESDAVAEGMERIELTSDTMPGVEPPFNRVHPMTSTYAAAFEQAWEKAYPGSWAKNEWVWAISFKRIT